MRGIYQSVDDVDLFIGGMSELKVAGSLLGPTFLCLIGDQMARLRRGDRFFYEEGGQPSSFTLGSSFNSNANSLHPPSINDLRLIFPP